MIYVGITLETDMSFLHYDLKLIASSYIYVWSYLRIKNDSGEAKDKLPRGMIRVTGHPSSWCLLSDSFPPVLSSLHALS